ncbi:hypothetical protein ACXIUS_12230 [Bosea thiooxidans]|nr:hypothetical protein [Bosea sp. (in: a-proteobacteria)]
MTMNYPFVSHRIDIEGYRLHALPPQHFVHRRRQLGDAHLQHAVDDEGAGDLLLKLDEQRVGERRGGLKSALRLMG